MRPEHLPPCAAAHLPSRGTRRTLANTHRLGTALCIALVLLLITSCTMCPLLSGRRSSDEPTPIAESVAGAATPEPTPDAATLVQALEDGDWETRLAAAHAVPEREDIPLPDRVTVLADAVQREVEQPSAEPQPDHSYLPVSGVVRLRLARSLGALGDDAIALLRDRAAAAEGDVRYSYLIALGYLGDRDVAPELGDALQSSDPVIRMDAARVLGLLGYREAIPALQAALEDPYVSEGEDSLGTYTIYPVREQAAGALEALGVTVERDGDTFTVSP